MASVIFEEKLTVPREIESLDDFRRWTRSEGFPQEGRVNYVSGRIEVDMSPESLYSHGVVSAEVSGVLWKLNKDHDLGELYSDRTRVSSASAELSAEPDVVFLSHESLDSDRVQLIPKAGRADDAIEIEGGPDLVVEIVSDSSVEKDTIRLPDAYFAAGVLEFWLIDARSETLSFRIQRRGENAFDPVELSEDGFQQSNVLKVAFRLDRRRNRRDRWVYDLQMKP